MKRLTEKLHNRSGASVVLALFVLLVVMMVSTVVLRAAVTNAGRVPAGKAEEQAYLTVSSAAGLLRAELDGLDLGWNDLLAPGVLTGGTEGALPPLLRDMAQEIRSGSTESRRSFTVSAENMDDVSVTLTLSDGWALRGELCLAGSGLRVNNYLTLRAPGVVQTQADGAQTLRFPNVTVSKGGNRA